MLAFKKVFLRYVVLVLALIAILASFGWLKYSHARRQSLLLEDEPGRSDSFKPYASRQMDGVDIGIFLDSRVALLFDSDHFPPTNGFLYAIRTGHALPAGVVKNMGCAAAIDRRGYFLTAAHCLAEKELRLVGREFGTNGAALRVMSPRVVWQGDSRKGEPDLAILKVKRPLERAFEMADDVHKNDPVMAVGLLMTNTTVLIQMEFMGGKILDCIKQKGSDGGSIVISDVPLRHGDSGGPLLNVDGRLVGIDTQIFYPVAHWLLPGGFISRSEHPDLKRVSEIIEKDFRDHSAAPK